MIKFLLDEMYSPRAAHIARSQGTDTISVHETDFEGTDDRGILLFAAEQQRCVVTDNVGDFSALANEAIVNGLPHAGVIMVPSHVGHNQHAPLARAITHFAQKNPGGLQPYEVRWLRVDLG